LSILSIKNLLEKSNLFAVSKHILLESVASCMTLLFCNW